jgi:hypothetical protein
MSFLLRRGGAFDKPKSAVPKPLFVIVFETNELVAHLGKGSRTSQSRAHAHNREIELILVPLRVPAVFAPRSIFPPSTRARAPDRKPEVFWRLEALRTSNIHNRQIPDASETDSPR